METYSDKLSIDTPENILLDAEIAGFGSRFVAALTDYIIISILLVGMTWLFISSNIKGSAILAFYYISIFLITWGYHLIFELVWNGQTPGKRRAGIRIIQSNGLPVTVNAILIRNIIRLFDFLPFFYGLGLVMLFATKRTQRLGDLAARTVVIREQRQVTLQTLKEDMRVQYIYVKTIDPIPSFIQIDQLTKDDRHRVVDYLQRRSKMANDTGLSDMLARQLAQKMGIDSFAMANVARQPDILLEQIARAFEINEHLQEETV
ncbi:MAG: RDD family protein [Anaerolineae bacterium]|nr:RDD family protein [Anaerolineae bacterium]